MKLSLRLTSIFVFVISLQSIAARHNNKENLCENYDIARSNQDLRGIRDVWNKIKESAIQSWNYIKGVAEETKAKIQSLVESVKEYANQIKKEFEEKLEELKQRLNYIIYDIYETGEQVKLCLGKEHEDMGIFLKTVIKIMGECVFDEIKKLPNINASPQIEFNETKFAKELDEKVEQCENDVEDFHDCIFKAREDIFDNFTIMEQDILKSHYETRGLVDYVKSTLITCSLKHIVDATNYVTNKAIEVINCVKGDKYDEIEDQNKNKMYSQ